MKFAYLRRSRNFNDPNYPERPTSTLLTDARKLRKANFEENDGPLGFYHELEDESYDRMSPEAFAEKFCLTVSVS